MRRLLLAVAFAALAPAIPVRAQICTPFTDVAASDAFCTNIQWMLNRGVTLGCHQAGQSPAYCPAQFVRRDQMAAFMNRLADEAVFQQGGNAFGAAAELGTTDNQALEVIVNNSRVMRFEPNAISPNVIAGSQTNNVLADVRGATIGGGGVTDSDPEVPGDGPNQVTDHYSTVSGGYSNIAGNGAGTLLDAAFATVGGGAINRAGGQTSSVLGGAFNTASGTASIIAGGQSNVASGQFSTVIGGQVNLASGTFSVVAGGSSNAATGNRSFAAGRSAKAQHNGCYVWADASTPDATSCFKDNEYIARAMGGFYFFTAGTTDASYTGAVLAAGTSAWAVYSDRNGKVDIAPVDTQEVLRKVVAMPLSTWRWNTEPGKVLHMGPMAQDFHEALGLGASDRGIATVDADGVALAAIKGLNAKLEAKLAERDAELAALRNDIAEMRQLLHRTVATR